MMMQTIKHFFGSKNGVAARPAPPREQLMLPRNDTVESLAKMAEELMHDAAKWECVKTFCAVAAEQELLAVTDNPQHAAACAYRAQALLGLPSKITDAILHAQSLEEARRERQAELHAEAAGDSPPKTSFARQFGRGAGRLA